MPARIRIPVCAVLLSMSMATPGQGQDAGLETTRFQALECPRPSQGSTWAILKRDGANREVAPYLSSLGQGEGGTGVITSPPFRIVVPSIKFTVRGHDGQGGGQDKNFVALVDARKGNVLKKTAAPGNDALQQHSWDVSDLLGIEVRFELHDHHSGGAFAWMGVGMIDAGESLHIDFQQGDFQRGMPEGWKRSEREAATRYEIVTGGVPFRQNASIHNVIPEQGNVEIPCGFRAEKLFLLGCTVGLGQPLDIHGGVELHYESGAVDVVPLMVGFTLDSRDKLLSPASTIHLHASGDPFQYYLPLAVRDEPLSSIRLVANPQRRSIPRITAITVLTDAQSPRLSELPAAELSSAQRAWIAEHSVSPNTLDAALLQAMRSAYRLPDPPDSPVRFQKTVVDTLFRSEGVAVADFDNDGALDIATGNQLHLGPEFREIQPLQNEPKAFPWKGYSDAFLCFDDDINGDGALDLLVVGFPGQATHWLENPGRSGSSWKKHLAVQRTGNESPDYVDVDGDGRRELLFMSGSRCAVARPTTDKTQPWAIQLIAGPNDPGAGHGLGVGDVNGDSLTDILSPNGWWQGPEQATSDPWQFHEVFIYGGAQLCVADLDGDGDNDVLGSSPHQYGIGWTEQTPEGWQQHMIDDADSQTHALHLADINRDGLIDFVTGKRFWAHNGHDPGSYERSVLCWYQLQRTGSGPKWIKHEIDGDSGVGLHFQIVDINGDNRLDIVTSNKKGVFVFQQY